MAWVELTLAPGLALPGSRLARLSALHAFPCQENSLSKIRLLCFSSGTVAAMWMPVSITEGAQEGASSCRRRSCLNRQESSSQQWQPQHLWHALSSTGKSALWSSSIPAKKQQRDAFRDKRDIWQPNVYIGGFYLLYSTSSKTSCPTFLPVLELLTWY